MMYDFGLKGEYRNHIMAHFLVLVLAIGLVFLARNDNLGNEETQKVSKISVSRAIDFGGVKQSVLISEILEIPSSSTEKTNKKPMGDNGELIDLADGVNAVLIGTQPANTYVKSISLITDTGQIAAQGTDDIEISVGADAGVAVANNLGNSMNHLITATSISKTAGATAHGLDQETEYVLYRTGIGPGDLERSSAASMQSGNVGHLSAVRSDTSLAETGSVRRVKNSINYTPSAPTTSETVSVGTELDGTEISGSAVTVKRNLYAAVRNGNGTAAHVSTMKLRIKVELVFF